MSRNKGFCNNCGKYSHSFNQCIEPITSIGIICTRFNRELKEHEYLLLCRKDTLGFIDFMRGKYSFYNLQHIRNIVDEMTIEEKCKLKTNDFDTLWNQLWYNNYGIKYRNEKIISKEKFDKIKSGILVNDQLIKLDDIINQSMTCWLEAEWEIPKGRRNYKERDLDTALREFEEETGISKHNIDVVYNIVPFDEVFTGSNYKSYRHRYFVAHLNKDVPLDKFQKCEVSNIKWVSYSNINKKIRDYSLEKKNVIKKVNKVLETYRIIF